VWSYLAGNGVHIFDAATATLTRITVTGCSSAKDKSDMFGGGVHIEGAGTAVNLVGWCQLSHTGGRAQAWCKLLPG